MNKIEQLAREATDLDHHESERGHVQVSVIPTGKVTVIVYVHNRFAFHHGETWGGDNVHVMNGGSGDFVTMEESGTDLDTVLDRMIERVLDAVADTPAEQVPA